ncbi:YchJ family protein [Idiomarina seosinensis]|uniref:UPF0225 protein CWI81_05045 n=1 Tax=Idiomarina seosinensis TaxID=281739 RepID=A0A432ZJ47_9GAMM|nr:YchJ family metal-binding protein [Idiomarina seosinensis]RUO77850.1 Zn-binding protein [Idiomarina seosinensis]
MSSPELCPCGSQKEYQHCCQLLHNGHANAETPEQLMRSRYSAFVKKLSQYLLKTWHTSTRPMTLDLTDSPDWVGLQVVSSAAHGDKGQVHFRAFYKDGGATGFMEEHSEFVRENQQWLYLNGKVS